MLPPVLLTLNRHFPKEGAKTRFLILFLIYYINMVVALLCFFYELKDRQYFNNPKTIKQHTHEIRHNIANIPSKKCEYVL